MTAAIPDFSHFQELRLAADREDPATLREVAGQFEALFVQMMMKNMRSASLAEPVFGNSDQHEMYQEMLDSQLATEMTRGRGIGLADMLVRQLGGDAQMPDVSNAMDSAPVWSGPEAFVRDLWPHAERAAKELQLRPQVLLAQAALETGWGQHVMRRPDGSNSHNLFGIKAGADWGGDTVTKRTLEYDNGLSRRASARFRAYADLAATFDDYVAFIGNNPRYASVPGHADDVDGFAVALQSSGYATDPAYADKIRRVFSGDTMQRTLSGLKTAESQPITRWRAP